MNSCKNSLFSVLHVILKRFGLYTRIFTERSGTFFMNFFMIFTFNAGQLHDTSARDQRVFYEFTEKLMKNHSWKLEKRGIFYEKS